VQFEGGEDSGGPKELSITSEPATAQEEEAKPVLRARSGGVVNNRLRKVY